MLADFSAVIFDMDGLVLDTEPTYCVAWQQTALAMGIKLPANFSQLLSGLEHKAVEEKMHVWFGGHIDLQAFNTLSSTLWRQYVRQHGIAVRPGFAALKDYLLEQRIPFALATNSFADNCFECLDYAGLNGVFQIIVDRDQVQQGKPAPDIFLAAAQWLQTPIEQCLVLEDSLAGIKAASAAGAIAVYIPSTQSVDEQALSLCDWLLPDLVTLQKLIQNTNPPHGEEAYI